MMQANATQGQGRQDIANSVLNLIAATPTPELSIQSILQLAQQHLKAQGASFVLFDEPNLVIKTGSGEDWKGRENQLQSVIADLPNGWHSPDMPSRDKGWVVSPIRPQDQTIGAIWLSFTAPIQLSSEEKLLGATLIDGLTILAANIQAKEIYERSHQLTMALLHSMTDPLLVLDDDQKLLLMNPAAEGVFSVKSTDAKGKSLREIVQAEALAALAEEGKAVNEWVTEDEKTFMPRIQVVEDSDKNVEGWVMALRDVTQFKKLNRNQSEFMRIVSHDLRSPLTAMQGFASMLELELVGSLNEKQKHFVTKILAGITQMTALVDNIQDAGRFDPETGFYDLTRSQCDLGEMIRKIVENHLVPAEKSLSIAVEVDDDVPIVHIDANMVERAIINLFDNAIKYTPSGGKITIGVKRVNNEAVIMVRDTGLGINQDAQKHLFERHVRLAREEHKKIKGSGLGLFIVRSVAQRHGGDAWVESEEGDGSTFFLGIPLEGPNLIGSQG